MVLVRPVDQEFSKGSEDQLTSSVDLKTPKRVLHFCDGVLEEYSTDEEDDNRKEPVLDLANLTWGAWIWYKAWSVGSSTLSAVDTAGEFLSSIFGITTPRYYFELEEYKRRENEKLKQQEDEQGWSQPSRASISVPLKEMPSRTSTSLPVDV